MTDSRTSTLSKNSQRVTPSVKRQSSHTGKRRPRADRLSPEARKELILAAAAGLVLKRGISGLSLEAVAAAARVSKPLIYKYFPNRGALLNALLHREFERMDWFSSPPAELFQGRQTAANRRLLDEALQKGVHEYLDYLVERGGLFQMLVNDPNVARHAEAELQAGRQRNMQFWTQHVINAYGMPPEFARVGVIMTTRALEGALGSVRSGKIEPARLAELWTIFVRAGWKAVGERYGDG